MLPRLYRVLLLLHQRILINSATSSGPDKEAHLLALGQRPTESLQRVEKQDVQSTNPDEP